MQVFGASLGLDASERARQAEGDGFDGIVAVDHFYSGSSGRPAAWRVQPLVALGLAAAATSRITLAAMVMNVNFHHPAVIAHALQSLHQVSGGRAELGLGAGWYPPEHHAFGLPWESGSRRQERVLEAARICRGMLANRGVISYSGAFFHVENDVPWDWPAMPARVPVAIGAAQPEFLCRAAEIADRIDLFHVKARGASVVDEANSRSADRLAGLLAECRQRASAADNTFRVSATVTAVVVPQGEVTETRRRLAPALSSTPRVLERDLLYVVGSQDGLMQALRQLAELGVDRVHVIPAPPEPERTTAAVGEMLHDIQRIANVTRLTA